MIDTKRDEFETDEALMKAMEPQLKAMFFAMEEIFNAIEKPKVNPVDPNDQLHGQIEP